MKVTEIKINKNKTQLSTKLRVKRKFNINDWIFKQKQSEIPYFFCLISERM